MSVWKGAIAGKRRVKTRPCQLVASNQWLFNKTHLSLSSTALRLNLSWMPTADNYKPREALTAQRGGTDGVAHWTPDPLHTPSVCCGLREVQDGSQQAVKGRPELGEIGALEGGMEGNSSYCVERLPCYCAAIKATAEMECIYAISSANKLVIGSYTFCNGYLQYFRFILIK